MQSKTLLITGVCTNGIGYEACRRILEIQRVARTPISWNLILAQRDEKSDTAEEARKNLENIAKDIKCSILVYKCDLTRFESIHNFANRIEQDDIKVDVMLLNAGLVSNKYNTTVDSNEVNYQVNHLGHFLLLSLLQARIQERVIFVGSSLHKKADPAKTLLSIEDRALFHSGMAQYSQSKLLSAYCLNFWHTKFKSRDVKVIIASPGFIPSSRLSRDNSRLAQLAMSWILHYMPFARTLQQGGYTLAALAIGQEWSTYDNCYVNADLQQERMHEDVYNHEHSQRIWQWSQDRTGIPSTEQPAS